MADSETEVQEKKRGGQDIVIRWSLGDWAPVDHASKLWGLSLVPIMGAIYLIAGLAVLQHFTTTPLILEAETYEGAGPDTAALHASYAERKARRRTASPLRAPSWTPAPTGVLSAHVVIDGAVDGNRINTLLPQANCPANGDINPANGNLWYAVTDLMAFGGQRAPAFVTKVEPSFSK